MFIIFFLRTWQWRAFPNDFLHTIIDLEIVNINGMLGNPTGLLWTVLKYLNFKRIIIEKLNVFKFAYVKAKYYVDVLYNTFDTIIFFKKISEYVNNPIMKKRISNMFTLDRSFSLRNGLKKLNTTLNITGWLTMWIPLTRAGTLSWKIVLIPNIIETFQYYIWIIYV